MERSVCAYAWRMRPCFPRDLPPSRDFVQRMDTYYVYACRLQRPRTWQMLRFIRSRMRRTYRKSPLPFSPLTLEDFPTFSSARIERHRLLLLFFLFPLGCPKNFFFLINYWMYNVSSFIFFFGLFNNNVISY